MTAERGPRRPGSMSDADRALGGAKHRSSPFGVPAVEIDDATPPPSEPPSLESLPGFAYFTPEQQAVLRTLHNVQREQDVALTRMWPNRKAHGELEELRAIANQLSTIVAPLSQLPQVLRVQATQIAELRGWATSINDAAKKLDAAVVQLTAELQEMRLDRVKQSAALEALETRVTTEVAAIRKELEAVTERADKASGRIESLEHDRIRVRAWAALIGLLAGLLAWLAGHFGVGKGGQ